MAASLALEGEIEAQLAEQREAVEGLEALLALDASPELEKMKGQLQAAVQELERALLDLKKERLLRSLDAGCSVQSTQSEQPGDAGSAGGGTVHAVSGASDGRDGNGAAVAQNLLVQQGEKYRFRYTDGRWYSGLVVDATPEEATLQFLLPTKPHMLAGVHVPVRALKPYRQPDKLENALAIGLRVLVQSHQNRVWQAAEVLAVHAAERSVRVVMHESGQHVTLPQHAVALSAYADVSDNEDASGVELVPMDDPEGSQDGDESQDDDEEEQPVEDAYRPVVFGRVASAMSEAADAVLQAAEAGPQTDTAHFATWELHTRGIGSRLLAGMGYVRGAGLGSAAKGVVAPLEVQAMRPGAGLGSAGGAGGIQSGRRKKKRGGERSRRRKFAEEARAAKHAKHDKQQAAELAVGAPGLFAFINGSLGDQSEAAALQRAQRESHDLRKAQRPNGLGKFQDAGAAAAEQARRQPGDRKALASQQETVAAAQQKVARLRETAARNTGDKGLSAQIARRIAEAQKELAAVMGAHARAEQAIHDKGKQKRWMKF